MATINHQVLGVPDDQTGSLKCRLEGFVGLMGSVGGAFWEDSQDLHHLVQVMAESRLRVQGQGSQGVRRGAEPDHGPDQKEAQLLCGKGPGAVSP